VVLPGGEGLGIGGYSKAPDLAWQYIKASWLSKEGELLLFKATGSIPVRGDIGSSPEVAKDTLAQPFIAAAHTVGPWPNNPKTAEAQTAIGKAVSGVVSGQLTPEQATDQAISGVQAALQAGGGGC
jgi:multiple sugar transport system substrate-binding protein